MSPLVPVPPFPALSIKAQPMCQISVPLSMISWGLLEPMLMRLPGTPLTEPPGADPPIPVDTFPGGTPLMPLNFDVRNFFDPTLCVAAEPELPTPPAPALSRQ